MIARHDANQLSRLRAASLGRPCPVCRQRLGLGFSAVARQMRHHRWKATVRVQQSSAGSEGRHPPPRSVDAAASRRQADAQERVGQAPDRFVCRVGCQDSVWGDDGTVYLEDPALLNLSIFSAPPPTMPVRFDKRYDQAVLWDGEAHVLLANRREALVFDVNGRGHRPVVFVAEAGATRYRMGGPNDRGVIQVVAAPSGGWFALLAGGTLTQLSIDGDEAILRPTAVRRGGPRW